MLIKFLLVFCLGLVLGVWLAYAAAEGRRHFWRRLAGWPLVLLRLAVFWLAGVVGAYRGQ